MTAQRLLIASSGSAIWKLRRLAGFGDRFKVHTCANRDPLEVVEKLSLWRQRVGWPDPPMLRPLGMIRSLAYFSPVIEEVLQTQPSPEYFQHLRSHIAKLPIAAKNQSLAARSLLLQGPTAVGSAAQARAAVPALALSVPPVGRFDKRWLNLDCVAANSLCFLPPRRLAPRLSAGMLSVCYVVIPYGKAFSGSARAKIRRCSFRGYMGPPIAAVPMPLGFFPSVASPQTSKPGSLFWPLISA